MIFKYKRGKKTLFYTDGGAGGYEGCWRRWKKRMEGAQGHHALLAVTLWNELRKEIKEDRKQKPQEDSFRNIYQVSK